MTGQVWDLMKRYVRYRGVELDGETACLFILNLCSCLDSTSIEKRKSGHVYNGNQYLMIKCCFTFIMVF